MDPQALLSSAAKSAAIASRGPTVRAMVERGATAALDRADEAAATLGSGPRKVAQAALGELRARLPEIADLGRDGLVLVVARAAGVAWRADTRTLEEALVASAEQQDGLVSDRDADIRIHTAACRIAAAVGEAAAKVALGLIVGAAR